MKIIEIIPQLSQGGAERFVVDLCNEMSKEHEVLLVVLHPISKHGLFVREVNESVRLICMNKRKGIDLGLFFRLFKLIKLEKPTVVHTHLRSIAYIILAYLMLPKIKFFHTVHNDAAMEAGGLLNKWCRKLAFRLGWVSPITISEESQQSFKKYYHLPSSLIYNGRPVYDPDTNISSEINELERVKTNKNSKIIVNVARVQPQKNQYVLAKVIDDLNQKGHGVELAIIGEKANKKLVEDIEKLESPYIHFLGVRDNPRSYMRAADAFCLSSIYEGMPITLIECFSVGAIPICTSVGGVMNMIHDGVNGILAKSAEQEDIEFALMRFLELSKEDMDNMRKNSFESFKNYDMESCAKKYIVTFKK